MGLRASRVGVGLLALAASLALQGCPGNGTTPTTQGAPQQGATSGGQATPPPKPTKKPVATEKVLGPWDSDDLVEEYEKNEIAADAKFRQKLVQVHGVTRRIAKDILDDMFVTLSTSDRFNKVQAYFTKSHAAELAKLEPFMDVQVVGRCDGSGMGNVILRDCHLTFRDETRPAEETEAADTTPKESPAEVAHRRGTAAFNAKNYDEAIAAYTEALKADPNLDDALLGRASARMWKDDAKGALLDLDAYVARHPDDLTARANRGMARERAGDLPGALADADAVVQAKPTDAESYVNRSFVRAKLKDLKGAVRDDSKVLELRPNDAPSFYRRAKSKAALGDTAGACDDFSSYVAWQKDAAAKQTVDEARAFLKANGRDLDAKPTPAPVTAPPDEATRKWKLTKSLNDLIGVGAVSFEVSVKGATVSVTIRSKRRKTDEDAERNADGLISDVLGVVADDDPTATSATVTVLDTDGNVLKTGKK